MVVSRDTWANRMRKMENGRKLGYNFHTNWFRLILRLPHPFSLPIAWGLQRLVCFLKLPLIPIESTQKNASFFQFQRKPGDCVLASTVAFNRNDKCTWLCLYLFDCCRDCNAKHYKCRQKFPGDDAAPECYRDHYGCMRRCLLEHNPPENVQSA